MGHPNYFIGKLLLVITKVEEYKKRISEAREKERHTKRARSTDQNTDQ